MFQFETHIVITGTYQRKAGRYNRRFLFLPENLDAHLFEVSCEGAKLHYTYATPGSASRWRMCGRERTRLEAAERCQWTSVCCTRQEDSLRQLTATVTKKQMGKRLQTVATMACMKTLLMVFNFVFWVSWQHVTSTKLPWVCPYGREHDPLLPQTAFEKQHRI
jgi:hypothetical protein